MASEFPDESSTLSTADTDSLASITQMVGDLNHTTDVRHVGRVALYAILTGNSCLVLDTNEFVERVNAGGGRGFRCTDPKPAMEQIAATGSHFYTISYRPTNPNWNGAYRKIHLDVAGYAQPPFTLRWSQLITGWADDVEPTLLYRHGYFARAMPSEPNSNASFGSAALSGTRAGAPTAIDSRAPRRRLISVSPRGAGPTISPGFSNRVQAATAFASLTSSQLHFTISAAATPEQEKMKSGGILPEGNNLTGPFRDGPYRNYRIHYWIDPQDLHFVRTAAGIYHDELKVVIVVYRDDGVAANSCATITNLDLSADELEHVQAVGITLDQPIAVPVYDNFFLRAVVSENSTNRIGALEIPAEWIHLGPPQSH
jgi:hypothetical protein